MGNGNRGEPAAALADDTHPLGKTRLAGATTRIVMAALTAVVMSRFVSEHTYLFDMVAAVSFFAAGPLLLLAMIAILRREPGVGAVGLFVALVALAPLLYHTSSRLPADGADQRPSTLLICNLHAKEDAWRRLLPLIQEEHPDIIGLCEVNDAIVERLANDTWIRNNYPFTILPRPGFEWTQVVLSRHELKPLERRGEPAAERVMFSYWRAATVDLPQGRIIFSLEHIPSPRSAHSWALGNERIVMLGEIVRRDFQPTNLPILVAGDFNSTPTAHRDRLMRSLTGLHPDDAGTMLRGSWPSWLPWYLRLPLDGAWGSDRVSFASRRVLRDVGSDHRPVLIGFSIR